jgi:GLPGLI family protein
MSLKAKFLLGILSLIKNIINMKIFKILLLLPYILFSQNQEIGLVKYNYKIPAKKTLIKNSYLYFNNNKTIFLFDKEGMDIDNSGVKTNNEGAISMSFKTSDKIGSQFYRDFNKKQISYRYAKTTLFNAFTVEDTWIKINWKIKNKFKKIGNYKCQKAVGDFRGRKYTAWFTEEIPLQYGPWKLFGLPGLILEAEDSEKMFVAKFKEIKYPCDCDFNFEKPKAEESKTLKEYVEYRDNYYDYVFRKIKSRLSRNTGVTIRQNPKSKDGRKYRDEKTFEWEEK